MFSTTEVKTEGRLLQLLESEKWKEVRVFLKQGHKLSCPDTIFECLEFAMLAVRKAPDFLVPLLIDGIDMTLVFPSMHSLYDNAQVYNKPLLHNVCLDHKHESVALVLHSLGIEAARKEASRFDHVSLVLGDDKLRLDYDFLFTPIQSAWETMLMEEDLSQVIQSVTSLEDLHLPIHSNLLNLWLITMILLMAMDGQTIIPAHGLWPTSWSVIHAISRSGHLMHSAVMWLAMHLLPDSLHSKDIEGSSVLHTIASNSIYYRSLVRHDQQHYADSVGSSLAKDTTPLPWERSPLQMILSRKGSELSLASSIDKNGRLPLHLILVSYEETQETYKKLKSQQIDFDSERGFILNIEESIDELLSVYPSAIEVRDPPTGLLPFMLAASIHSMPLDVIYNLLIRDPTLVTSSSSRSSSISTGLKRKCNKSNNNDVFESTSSTTQEYKKRNLGYCPMTMVQWF